MSELNDVVEDDTIATVIEQVEALDATDPPSVEEVRDLLAHGDPDGDDWDEWLERIEAEYRVVAQRDRLVVLDTGQQGIYADVMTGYEGTATVDEVALRVVATLHRRLAGEFAPDHDWTLHNPYVLVIPDHAAAGQRYVDAVLNGLLRRGLSPGQAWAYYGVQVRGNSRNTWATRCGYSDHSAVSSAVRKAESKLA